MIADTSVVREQNKSIRFGYLLAEPSEGVWLWLMKNVKIKKYYIPGEK